LEEQYVLSILLGTSLGPKSAEDLSATCHVPFGECAAILGLLEKRGYVANVLTAVGPDGKAVRYYLRTELKLGDLREELSPETLRAQLSQSP
jgi:hypothetical protein